jgi:hypothetical protein
MFSALFKRCKTREDIELAQFASEVLVPTPGVPCAYFYRTAVVYEKMAIAHLCGAH